MDYKEKYEQALSKARQFSENPLLEDSSNIVEYIFPELAESEDERIRKRIIATIHLYYGEPLEDEAKEMIAWLEKQGEPTDIPADAVLDGNKDGLITETIRYKREKQGEQKIKSKFHEGDWIINSQGTLRHIINVDKGGYQTDGGWLTHDTYEKAFHLWTIQDAKDGDVLISFCNQPFIYNGKFTEISVGGYCGLDVDGNFIENSPKECNWTCNEDIKPATKEQRDTLIKAMADAGYTFDFERKELNKIYQKPAEDVDLPEFESHLCLMFQKFRTKGICTNGEIIDYVKEHSQKLKDILVKPAWSEEDNNKINSIKYLLHELDNYNFDNWLRNLKDRVQPQPKQEWSGGEEVKINRIVACLENLNVADNDILLKDVDWLKSLRPQNHWKPSDEQIEILDMVLTNESMDDNIARILRELREQLKKLREE